ncbi:MAG TPA: hypothetical protein VJU61_25590 [Polyangiaceae bacterium]|nr:hypothetical protein [Polyangiaceae bacterium]
MGTSVPLISRVQFVQAGSRLTAVEIVRRSRAPVIARLHRTLMTLGIVISSYQALTGASEITERIVFERGDGGSVESQLSDAAKEAILRVAIEDEGGALVSSSEVADVEVDGSAEAEADA